MSKETWIKLGRPEHLTDADEMMAAGIKGADGKTGPPVWLPISLLGRIPAPPLGWTHARDGYEYLNEHLAKAGATRRYRKPTTLA